MLFFVLFGKSKSYSFSVGFCEEVFVATKRSEQNKQKWQPNFTKYDKKRPQTRMVARCAILAHLDMPILHTSKIDIIKININYIIVSRSICNNYIYIG